MIRVVKSVTFVITIKTGNHARARREVRSEVMLREMFLSLYFTFIPSTIFCYCFVREVSSNRHICLCLFEEVDIEVRSR